MARGFVARSLVAKGRPVDDPYDPVADLPAALHISRAVSAAISSQAAKITKDRG